MSEKKLGKVKYTVFVSVLMALSVVTLWLGCATDIFDLCTLMIASLFPLMALMEMNRTAAYAVYLGTSVLSFILLSGFGFMVPILYSAFCGLYPIIKFRIDKCKPPIRWLLKELYFNLVAVGAYFLSVFVFMLEDMDSPHMLILFAVMAEISFILYDILLKRAVILYFNKIRPRLFHDKA